MNQLELEYARKRKNKTKADMAAAIGKSVGSYAKKAWSGPSRTGCSKSRSRGM